jgi:hypothetical protein
VLGFLLAKDTKRTKTPNRQDIPGT